jgi:hypothetical protein
MGEAENARVERDAPGAIVDGKNDVIEFYRHDSIHQICGRRNRGPRAEAVRCRQAQFCTGASEPQVARFVISWHVWGTWALVAMFRKDFATTPKAGVSAL